MLASTVIIVIIINIMEAVMEYIFFKENTECLGHKGIPCRPAS